ncbi:MAG TPA: MCE family protein [Jatrophihabitantaceae bacterium]|nr:MCE family protein [Jatrophihabitantaceae bacterium]
MKAMQERDQAMVAIVGTIVGALLVLLSMNLRHLPLLSSPGTTYRAEFANSGGMTSGADVRVAGISVGSVKSVKVAGDHVEVRFTVRKGVRLGSTSGASIEIATVLGELFMQVESAGPGRLLPGSPIPVARTTVPYTLLDAFGALGQNTKQTDLPTLRRSLDQLAATVNATSPADVSATLTGLSRMAQAVASRQDEVTALLRDAGQVAKTLATNGGALVSLLSDGDTFLQLLVQRHAAINQLLVDTARLGAELRSLITQNGAQLTPLLTNLATVSGVLASDKAQLEQSIKSVGQFSTNIANVTGSGPWIDLLLPAVLEPDNVIAACGMHPTPGCGGS